MTPFIISTPPLYKQLFGHFRCAIKTQANREILGRGGFFNMTRINKRTLTLVLGIALLPYSFRGSFLSLWSYGSQDPVLNIIAPTLTSCNTLCSSPF